MEYAAAHAKVEQAKRKKAELLEEQERGNESHRKKMHDGITLPELQAYAAYFDDIRNSIEIAERDVVRTQRIADRKQAELVELFREIKLLEGLRKEQYLAYLKEENAKETKELENLLAYNAASGEKG